MKQKRPPTVSRPELMPDGTDRQFRHMIHNLLTITQTQQDNRERFGKMLNITAIQYTILTAIAHLSTADEGVAVVGIAKHLYITGSFVSMETNKLTRLGLIEKIPDPEDKRRLCLSLTQRGWECLESIVTVQQPVNDAFFDRLTTNDFLELSRLLSILAQNAGRAKATLMLLKEEFRLDIENN